MSSNFIISLDFELMWGVRDHKSLADYGDAILGGRVAIPEILHRFDSAGINATWATVGLLFAKNRDEMMDHFPTEFPAYENSALSPYDAIKTQIGRDELDDPLHFGASLVDQISQTQGQEIATHTYSHYYCLEQGQTLSAFDADIASAHAIAQTHGHSLKSIVFPRNQFTPAHLERCFAQGISCHRGNPESFAYQPKSGAENTLFVRGIRFVDSIMPITGDKGFENSNNGNAPASRFLRPWNKRLPLYSDRAVRVIQSEMKQAAKRGKSYHLWWHPHNFGRNMDQNLNQLDRILETFRTLQDQFGMTSTTMLTHSKQTPQS